MTVMVARTAWRQRVEEEFEDSANASPEDSVHLPLGATPSDRYGSSEWLFTGKKRALGVCRKQDIIVGFGTLFTVILCGVLRAHASSCAAEMNGPLHRVREACHH